MTDDLLWYAMRGAGAVSLVLLSATVVLGLLARMRVESARWPRFLTAHVHQDISLLAVGFLVIHIVTAIADPYSHLCALDALVPWHGAQTLWVALGVVSLDLMLALVITSLLRGRLVGPRTWRAVHWAAYAAWPLAVIHGVGAGTDTRTSWLTTLTIACCAVVVGAAAARAGTAPRDPLAGDRRVSELVSRAPERTA